MKRLTAYYGDCEEAYLSCERCGKTGIHECWTQEDCTQTAVDRLAAIEDILGDDYDLDRLKVIVNQCMTMREEVSQRFSLTAKIPIDRLRELVEADRDGRCVVLPKDGMMYYIEESDGERWIGNKPIQDIIFLYGWGLASLKCSISEIGETKHFSREAAEAALKGEQDG